MTARASDAKARAPHRFGLSLLLVIGLLASVGPGSFGAIESRAITTDSATEVGPPQFDRSLVTLGPRWAVQPSGKVARPGSVVSGPGFTPRGWLAVHNDGGGAPGTFLAARLQNGYYPNIFYSANMEKYFGPYSGAFSGDAIPVGDFNQPWWYRTSFVANPLSGQNVTLLLNGIIPSADVWLNGVRVATHDQTPGAYASYTFDVTRLLRPRGNVLALLIYPNNPRKQLTVDSADWSQPSPDNNAGVQFPVQLRTTGAISIDHLRVSQDDAPNVTTAALTVVASLTNHSPAAQVVSLRAQIGARRFARTVTVPAASTATVSFTPAVFPQLLLDHPHVWWPYQLGAQPMYRASLTAEIGGRESDRTTTDFGIRTVTSYLTAATATMPTGARQFVINGKRLVVRGGGWAQDLFLRYSPADTAQQIAYIKNLGLDAVRNEGNFMPTDWYNQMDRAGILIMAGYQCCDKWDSAIVRSPLNLLTGSLPEGGETWTTADYATAENSSFSLGERLGDHPSVFVFYIGSDDAPIPTQESFYLKGFMDAGWQQPIVSAVSNQATPRLGFSGTKEGPYDWVPPVYFYDSVNDPPLLPYDLNGTAYGFDAEESTGNTIPTLDSLHRFMSPSDLSNLWQNPSAVQYHTNAANNTTLAALDGAMRARYGPWTSLSSYVAEAQASNYETARAQFEAFVASAKNPTPSTGTIYWMLNKGAPSLLWFLYNKDGNQPGAYYGAQEANRPIHVLYDYATGDVDVDNLTSQVDRGLTVNAVVHSIDGAVESTAVSTAIDVAPQDATVALHPVIPASTSTTYFLELTLTRGKTVVDRNVYWLSTKPDKVDPASAGLVSLVSPSNPTTTFADLTGLQSLRTATVRAAAQSRTTGRTTTTAVTITNTSPTSTVAYLIRADVRRATAQGRPLSGDNEVRPITWSSNDVTLWPGESETLTASYPSGTLQGGSPAVTVTGWNVTPVTVH